MELFKKLSQMKKLTRRSPPKITWKHSSSTDEIKNALTNSAFRALPTEVMLHIFKFLNVRDLGNVSLVCRSFKMIADQDEIWKLKCNLSTKLHWKSFKEIYMDWMHEKYLRNIELEQVEAEYRKQSSHVACGMRCPPPKYPVRPVGKHDFALIGGFKQHPNESEDIRLCDAKHEVIHWIGEGVDEVFAIVAKLIYTVYNYNACL